MDFAALSDRILSDRRFLIALAIINLIGFVYGIHYYSQQLSVTPMYLWVFTLDSPLPVLAFAFIAYLFYSGKKVPQWLLFLAIVGLVKYGFWTELVIFLFRDYFFAAAPVIYAMNLILHIGMIAEGAVLISRLNPKSSDMLVVLAFFLLNDILDYFFGTLPIIPGTYNDYLLIESVAASIAIPAVLFLKRFKRKT